MISRNKFTAIVTLAVAETYVVWQTSKGNGKFSGSDTADWFIGIFVLAPLSVIVAMVVVRMLDKPYKK
jgi:hypothetical protein